jgi:hypothetical protein
MYAGSMRTQPWRATLLPPCETEVRGSDWNAFAASRDRETFMRELRSGFTIAQLQALTKEAKAETPRPAVLVTELTRVVSLVAQTGLQFDLRSAQGKLIASLMAALGVRARSITGPGSLRHRGRPQARRRVRSSARPACEGRSIRAQSP